MLKEDSYTDEARSDVSEYEQERNKPLPNRVHGTIQSQLNFQLLNHNKNRFDFPSEVALNTTPGSTPDICIFPKKELDWETTEAKEEEAPLTVVEIISPSQSFDEMAKKIYQLYFPMGVKSAWLVMPPPLKSICVMTPDGKNRFFESGTLKDDVTRIEINIEKVFEGMK